MSGERCKAFILTSEAVVDLLSGRTRAAQGMIPESAKVVRYSHQWETNAAIIILADESFPLVDEGSVLEPESVTTMVMERMKI